MDDKRIVIQVQVTEADGERILLGQCDFGDDEGDECFKWIQEVIQKYRDEGGKGELLVCNQDSSKFLLAAVEA